MGFLNKLLKRKEKEESVQKEFLDRLDEKNIIYSVNQTDDGFRLTYLDVFDKEKYIIIKNGDHYKLNGKSMAENEIEEILENQSQIDNEMETLLYDPDNDKLIQVYDFFKKVFSHNLISIDLSLNEKKELAIFFSTQDKGRFASIHIDNKSKKIVYDKTGEFFKRSNIVIRLIEDIKEQLPLLFDTGELKVPEGTVFTDLIKTYLVNTALVERLNQTKNIEAKLIDVSGNSMIFIIFRNGAALEYISATKQNPSGKLLLMDVDEDTTLENNEEYWIVKKILKLPAYMNNKPDEENMPIRKFANKKA